MSMLPDRGVVSWSGGIEASVVCVDTATLAAGFCGAPCDTACLRRLPEGVCPCGEDGEFHTFVRNAPCVDRPRSLRRGRGRVASAPPLAPTELVFETPVVVAAAP